MDFLMGEVEPNTQGRWKGLSHSTPVSGGGSSPPSSVPFPHISHMESTRNRKPVLLNQKMFSIQYIFHNTFNDNFMT